VSDHDRSGWAAAGTMGTVPPKAPGSGLTSHLSYFSVAKIEKAVAVHYATVRLPQDFCGGPPQ
jgi:hypothetical protein